MITELPGCLMSRSTGKLRKLLFQDFWIAIVPYLEVQDT